MSIKYNICKKCLSNYGDFTECDVKGCKGFYTQPGVTKVITHIKKAASWELLRKELLGSKESIHIDFLKEGLSIDTSVEII